MTAPMRKYAQWRAREPTDEDGREVWRAEGLSAGWLEPNPNSSDGGLRFSGPAAEPIHLQPGKPTSTKLGARPLTAISTDPPEPLELDRLDPEGHTILFGPGGAGKGALAAWWAAQLNDRAAVVLVVDYENHPNEWARRIASLGCAALEDIHHVSPAGAAWQGKRGAIWEQAKELRRLADELDATHLFIDSIVPACGGTDALKPEAASQYAAALSYIGRPALSLAHVTKEGDQRYPFGSVFWHNLARTTWGLERVNEYAVLTHRKSNNYAALGRFMVTMTWHEGRLMEVSESGYRAKLRDLVREALAAGEMTVPEIVERLNEDLDEDAAKYKPDSIRAVLRRGIKSVPKDFTVEGTGASAKWRVVA